MKKINSNKGLTLIEIMISIGILTIIMSLGLIISLSSFKKYYYRSEESILVATLERARSEAINNYFETPHGVCYIAPNYVILYGKTCVANPKNELISANVSIATASNFSATLSTPIIFTQLSGTTTPRTIFLTDGISSTTIAINSEGTINW